MTSTTSRARTGRTRTTQAGAARAAAVPPLEVELTLLARHHLQARQTERLRLDRSGYQLLSRLDHSALSQRALAEAFRLDQSTINRQAAALERKGLLERVSDPDGGPARLLRPTTEGRRLLDADRAELHAALGRVLADWEPADIDRFRTLLERFNTSIERLEGTAWPRS